MAEPTHADDVRDRSRKWRFAWKGEVYITVMASVLVTYGALKGWTPADLLLVLEWWGKTTGIVGGLYLASNVGDSFASRGQ